MGKDKNKRKRKVERRALSSRRKKKRRGEKAERKRKVNEKETKRNRCVFFQGKFFKLSSIPEDFSLDLLALSFIPCKSPRKYKNSSRQRM